MLPQTIKIILISFTVCAFFGCAGDSAASKSDSEKKPAPNDMTIKRSLLEKIPPPNALLLETEKSFTPSDDKIFSYPVSLAASGDGRIYVSDNNSQAIYEVSSDLSAATRFSKEKTEKEEEKLKYPNSIRFYRDKVFIADNEGIKVFKQNGEFEKLIRSFYSINDFTIDSEGNFLINANFLNPGQGNSLIYKLSESGARLSGIGKIPNPEENNGIEGKAFVETDGQNIVVAYQHLPLVQIYDTKSGDLIREFELKHPIFDDLKKLKNDKEFVNPRSGVVVLPRYVAGVKVSGGKLYLLLYLPNPEIVEVDFQGTESNRYRSNNISAINYFSFDVRFVGDARQFVVGVIEPSLAPTITVFNQNTKTKNNN